MHIYIYTYIHIYTYNTYIVKMLLFKLCACAPCLKPRMQEAKSVLKHYLKVRIEFSIHIILVTDINHYMIQTLC